MPSIDLARLRMQTHEIAETLGDPPAFCAGVRRLMEIYSHRLLRRGPSMARRASLSAWDVPGLMIRELEAAVLPTAQADPAAALAAADCIWESGRLEERQLAIRLAAASDNASAIRDRINRWLPVIEDPHLLEDLAEHAGPPFRRADPQLFAAEVRRWMDGRTNAVRAFGWLALRASLSGGGSEPVLPALELLPAALRETEPETIRLAADVLVRLQKAAPAETRAWLDSLPPELLLRGRPVLRTAMYFFPEDLAADLRRRMRRD